MCGGVSRGTIVTLHVTRVTFGAFFHPSRIPSARRRRTSTETRVSRGGTGWRTSMSGV